MGSWDFVRTILAGMILLGWASGEGIYHRRRIYKRLLSTMQQVK
ncbi:hypothetical protein HSB1_46500 [Halogranum salarium B-1]|uniref:Uncharacterized protein n=1 Tax=Halogranum salarium B-1 TaxID=1210908 RepID=J2ZUX0_9EURY|nr:hypothetical protein HSB1_46500 [Halogranum salarium B-1]